MSERISILNEMRSGGYEASLITTFNAYLPFYEDVVLRHLMGSGIRHNVLMMDAGQATLAVDRHPPRSAGRFYTLAPIKVGGAFHPKVILLVGKKKGLLLVGSHNLTLSGFGYNREMTNVIYCKGEEDVESAALLNSAWKYVLVWAESQSSTLPGHIIEMVKKVQDFAPWLQTHAGSLPENCRVLSTAPDAPSIWQQLLGFMGPGPAKQVMVSGAFFDAKLSFVEKVRDDLTPKELFVGVDPASVQFPIGTELSEVSFVNCASLGATEKDDKQAGYLHAKSIVIQRENGETVLAVGSANPSCPAWLAPGISQNVEMMIARKGEDARAAADELGLLAIDSMPPLAADDWQTIAKNWEHEIKSEQNVGTAQIVIALASDADIRFRVPGDSRPLVIECELLASSGEHSVVRQAQFLGKEYVLSKDGLDAQISLFRFQLGDKEFTCLVQHVKQIEGLSRTGSQRRFNEALSSLTTDVPNIEHFVDCIRDIIKISDSVTLKKMDVAKVGTKNNHDASNKKQNEGADLSIGLNEVVEQEHLRKHRLRSSDDLGYLLEVLLYNLRDETAIGLDDALEDRDAKGRSEEEQVDADDDDKDVSPLPAKEVAPQSSVTPHDPLYVCHHKVGTLVGTACEKLDALKQGRLELAQFIIIVAGILSALRLLRGLDGKVPWIAAGQSAVPQKELVKLSGKIAEVVYDGDKSIINLGNDHSQFAEFDEFARLKGLIIWLAWASGIALAKPKPFNESLEEQKARCDINRLYVATVQLIAGDEDVIGEAKQSIGQTSSGDMDWLEKLLAIDRLFRDACSDPALLQDAASAEIGDFGFNSDKPKLGIREILPKDKNFRALSFHNESRRKFIFPAEIIRTIPLEKMLKAQSFRINALSEPEREMTTVDQPATSALISHL